MTKHLTVGSMKRNSPDYNSRIKQDIPHSMNQGKQELIERPQPFQSGKVYTIQSGVACSIHPNNNQTLLDSAIQQGCHLEHKCKKGTCGKCAVRIMKGQTLLTDPNDLEQKKLGSQIKNGYRLACQSSLQSSSGGKASSSDFQ